MFEVSSIIMEHILNHWKDVPKVKRTSFEDSLQVHQKEGRETRPQVVPTAVIWFYKLNCNYDQDNFCSLEMSSQ